MSSEGMSVKNILYHRFTTWILSKMLLYSFKEIHRARFFFRNCAGSWYFYPLQMHMHQVTLLSGPGHLCFQHQQAEGEQTNPTRNSCAKYALSKIRVSRCFASLDWCGWHTAPLTGQAQMRNWLKEAVCVFQYLARRNGVYTLRHLNSHITRK